MESGHAPRVRLAALAALVATAACGVLGPAPASGPTAAGPEKTTLHVGVSPTPSSAGLYIAKAKGFFAAEGLTVETEIIQAPQAVMPRVLAGGMDVFKGSYVSLINVQSAGTARLKIVADALQAAPGIAGVVVPENSPLETPQDLKGRTIAVNSLANLGTMSVSAHLKPYLIAPGQVRFVAIDFQSQLAALRDGRVDAAWMVEPFLSDAQRAGAKLLLDTNTGPTDKLPVDGWAATEEWVRRHPRTTAAFQRALTRGQALAATDRALLAETVAGFTGTPRDAAMTMAMGTFPTSLSAARIQRVSDLMYEFGYLRSRVDVSSMVGTPPAR
ncbi:ABC transporter substrate-binding protein [Actinomadura sp. ATCC 31491]|uniref:ABC transporter substrate-binding protein n=1 Tax=Actinomadura luzonensis TaxID=2805427 RepID=A0ABT0FU25_9ACTN|nr:ABC transporter substrate-binding protein [Actinomadura luzonensis]MCK2215829.1 ABC transporter substrate-binding protein [Actinomadura luzonensis]